MEIKDKLKKVLNPELVESAADKLKEINESETSRKLKAAAKKTEKQLLNKLDDLAENPPKIPKVRIPENIKKNTAKGFRIVMVVASVVLGIGVGLAIIGFVGGIFRFVLGM